MEIKYKNESLGFHPDFTFVIGGGVRLGFSLPPSREFTRSICCWLGGKVLEGRWRGPDNHAAGAGGCITVPCWSVARSTVGSFGLVQVLAWTDLQPPAGTQAPSLSLMPVFLVPAICHACKYIHKEGTSLQRENQPLKWLDL